MRLRNKKTGEIKEYTHTMTSYHVPIDGGYEIFTPWKPEEWEELEDVKEPLIKDEKIRKAVRAWAEINGIKVVLVCRTFNAWGVKNKTVGEPGDEKYMLADILFRGDVPEELEPGEEYTIPELCGEEEE